VRRISIVKDSLQNYLGEVVRYTGAGATIPGLDLESDPIDLADVFVEPYISWSDATPSTRATTNVARYSANSVMRDEPFRSETGARQPISIILQNQQRKPIMILGEPGQGKTTVS